MLYIPKYYFSFFGMLASAVAIELEAFSLATVQLNQQRTQTLKLMLISTLLKATLQSKCK